jgi:hypothetical protein
MGSELTMEGMNTAIGTLKFVRHDLTAPEIVNSAYSANQRDSGMPILEETELLFIKSVLSPMEEEMKETYLFKESFQLWMASSILDAMFREPSF